MRAAGRWRKQKRELDKLDPWDPEVRHVLFRWTKAVFSHLNPRGYKELCVLCVLHIGEATTTELIEALPFSPGTTQQAIANLAGRGELDSKKRKSEKGGMGMITYRREHRKKYWRLTTKGAKYYKRAGSVVHGALQTQRSLLKDMFSGKEAKVPCEKRRKIAKNLLANEPNPKGFEKELRDRSKLRVSKVMVPRAKDNTNLKDVSNNE